MTGIAQAYASRPGLPEDNYIQPFAVEALDVRGRLVRIGPELDRIIRRHGYPHSVSRLLAEAVALTALLGTSLKFDGRFIVQTQTDGAVSMLVVDFDTPDQIRACARFDAEAVAALPEDAKPADLLGKGVLAMTIDQGPDMNRYQGVVALDGGTLEDAAHQYFKQSEQIPTFVRLAAAEMFVAGKDPEWRAGGLLIQHLPEGGAAPRDIDPGDAPEGADAPQVEEDDHWREARFLSETVEDHELTDPSVSSDALLYRLYHERGVRVFEPLTLVERCRCNRERVRDMLLSFTADDVADMTREDGMLEITCEFCSQAYEFKPSEIENPGTDEGGTSA
ncbi:Hsp33 family molecular chaperone [Tepidamorphus sp. 3E244]|uniref:Hsp33 family molecular chaperone n=1 Tax=Tepidamorphus sp. 3E244 TaxID=3385498 RepID=UPI0038FC8851